MLDKGQARYVKSYFFEKEIFIYLFSFLYKV